MEPNFIFRNTYAKESQEGLFEVGEQGISIEYVERLGHLEFFDLVNGLSYSICSRCSINSDRL